MLVDAQKAEEGSQTILYPRSFYLSLPKAVLKDKTTNINWGTHYQLRGMTSTLRMLNWP